MNATCDLHVHSVFSDGTDTPTQLIRQAEQLGLSALALCDHNTIAGLPEFLDAAKDSTVEAIPGIEFSTTYADLELHILALGLPAGAYAPIQEMLAEGIRQKEAANRTLIENLRLRGIFIDYDALKAQSPNGYINRAHIAAELTRLGYTASIREAFSTLLSPKHGLYQPPKWPEATRIITRIRTLGAIPVLAHPLLTMDAATTEAFLHFAVPAGLVGMETLYSRYDHSATAHASQLAQRFGLLPSGGSDYHGTNKPDVQLGTVTGAARIPLTFWQQLRSMADPFSPKING